jgi:GDP-4-dehydro-6-deoxy-D-mannose reductase
VSDTSASNGTTTRVLITGAGGFVGRHLADHLSGFDKYELIGIEAHKGTPVDGVKMLVCDLLDAELTSRVIKRHQPDVIFHLAAQAFVPQSIAAPAETLVNNSVAQINVLEACRRIGINPVIVIASSAEIYGAVPVSDMPITEEHHFRPSNPYAVSKVTQDMLGFQYAASYDMRIVRGRPFNHVGPGQSDRFVVSSFARQIAEVQAGRSDPIILVGNLAAERDFLDVRDVVRAYAMMADPALAGEAFNIASGQPRSIQSILDDLLRISSCEIEVRQDPNRLRPADIPVLVGDAGKLRQATGWVPEISMEQSLQDTLDYWRGRLASDY